MASDPEIHILPESSTFALLPNHNTHVSIMVGKFFLMRHNLFTSPVTCHYNPIYLYQISICPVNNGCI